MAAGVNASVSGIVNTFDVITCDIVVTCNIAKARSADPSRQFGQKRIRRRETFSSILPGSCISTRLGKQ